MRSAHKQKNPTISNVKSLDLWSEWRESNSRPLEPHSSALPKLRYTRISTAASLPKRGDIKYYTRRAPVCQHFFAIFWPKRRKSVIFNALTEKFLQKIGAMTERFIHTGLKKGIGWHFPGHTEREIPQKGRGSPCAVAGCWRCMPHFSAPSRC